jgi:hypothetical protein
MNASLAQVEPAQPVVAVICRVPILGEAIAEALDSFAVVRRFPGTGGDTSGLLRWLAPDAVVVDSRSDADAAAAYAERTDAHVVHVSLEDGTLRVLDGGNWNRPEGVAACPEGIRNVLVGGLFGRRKT